jgi:alkylation response protein AidB-like acyl-CoA dehydrogenase
MQRYNPPLKEIRFVLESLDYENEVASLEPYEAFDLETSMAVAKTVADIGVDKLLPLNKKGDEEGLDFDPETGSVTLPDGFRDAYQTLVENGLMGLTGDAQWGGAGAPEPLGILFSELVTSCNKSFSMAPGLTMGLVDALQDHATDEQKEKYLTKLVTGEWTGTMCLTEPQCGTDLGMVRTKAIPQDDGSYRLTGNKIWITFGEHNLTDNIIHFVLARLPDAPEGIKGISAFLVPKLNDDGSRNGIKCTGLEEKMGIHASPTCVMTMEDAVGEMVGEPHKGMKAMFTMMNMARLYVGVEGIALGEIAYQTALEFAKERRQGRSLDRDKREMDEPADNILVHPDVRRMLLNIKSTTEPMRALAAWLGMEYDKSHHHPDEEVRQEAKDLVALLTPVMKSYGSERGFFNISEAMQVCGGSGYTTDWDIEQYMRDERIAMIYEGTNHIQALDLVGRKLPRKGGRLLQTFQKRVMAETQACGEYDELADFVSEFQKAAGRLTEITMELASKGKEDPEHAAAIASNYLNLFALTALGYAWLKMARYAVENDTDNKAAKLKTARYFFEMVLPETGLYKKLCTVGKDAMMAFDVDEF